MNYLLGQEMNLEIGKAIYYDSQGLYTLGGMLKPKNLVVCNGDFKVNRVVYNIAKLRTCYPNNEHYVIPVSGWQIFVLENITPITIKLTKVLFEAIVGGKFTIKDGKLKFYVFTV